MTLFWIFILFIIGWIVYRGSKGGKEKQKIVNNENVAWSNLLTKETKICEDIIKEVAREDGVAEEAVEEEFKAYFQAPYKRPAERVLKILRGVGLSTVADFWTNEDIQKLKVSITLHFLSTFLLDTLLINTLNFWTGQSYNLTLEKIVLKMSKLLGKNRIIENIDSLYLETMAYGVTLLHESPYISLISLVDIENARVLNAHEWVAELLSRLKPSKNVIRNRYHKYSEARAKYIKTELSGRASLFLDFIMSTLSNLSKEVEKLSLIEPEALLDEKERRTKDLVMATLMLQLAPRAMGDILNWALSLRDEDVYKIAGEMENAIKIENTIKPGEGMPPLLKSYGFGMKYFNKIKKEELLPLVLKNFNSEKK